MYGGTIAAAACRFRQVLLWRIGVVSQHAMQEVVFSQMPDHRCLGFLLGIASALRCRNRQCMSHECMSFNLLCNLTSHAVLSRDKVVSLILPVGADDAPGCCCMRLVFAAGFSIQRLRATISLGLLCAVGPSDIRGPRGLCLRW